MENYASIHRRPFDLPVLQHCCIFSIDLASVSSKAIMTLPSQLGLYRNLMELLIISIPRIMPTLIKQIGLRIGILLAVCVG